MSTRSAQMIVLCEDLQHATFVRRLLISLGFPKRRIRVNRNPSGTGSGEQYVRASFPNEVASLRTKNYLNGGLVVVIDADTETVHRRRRRLNRALDAADVDRRGSNEPICVLIPKRNIETWIYALRGHDVNQTKAYPKLDYESNCQDAVDRLVSFLRDGCPDDVIPSLRNGCSELRKRLPE